MDKQSKESDNKLSQLTHIFPFLLSQQGINVDSIPQNEEFQNMIADIAKNKNSNEYLKGEANIVESMIVKYGKVQLKELSELTELVIQIPKNFGMLNDFGFYLPKLKMLNLSKSKIQSIDEIGISFKLLEVLNVSQCELEDLSGIICFEKLTELDASYNKIEDLVELEMCSSIKVLKLNDNKIEDEDNFSFLVSLPNLQILHINNNPFTQYISNWKFNNVQLDHI